MGFGDGKHGMHTPDRDERNPHMLDEAARALHHRFAYHPPVTDQTKHQHETVRAKCEDLAQHFLATLPPGREQALVLTHIEEAMFWANASIARNQPEIRPVGTTTTVGTDLHTPPQT